MSYKVRRVPETPCESLNSWLNSHYDEPTSSAVQYVAGTAICAFYEAASALNRAMLRARGDVDPKHAWMVACGVIGVAVAAAAWFAFTILMASSVIVHGILYYAAVLTAIGGLGLGAAGAFYFGKEGVGAKRGDAGDVASSEFHSTYRSTVTTSTEYTRSHED